mmetsp:Transcript_39704/g.102154  ORF Transcript_39704/g.102154 Transcript_39704/m.102154 type:complete len:166 (+) Transcript_39704:2632-3129(+)
MIVTVRDLFFSLFSFSSLVPSLPRIMMFYSECIQGGFIEKSVCYAVASTFNGVRVQHWLRGLLQHLSLSLSFFFPPPFSPFPQFLSSLIFILLFFKTIMYKDGERCVIDDSPVGPIKYDEYRSRRVAPPSLEQSVPLPCTCVCTPCGVFNCDRLFYKSTHRLHCA